MKFLHTSDWHLGKRLKSKIRLDEQKQILDEIVRIVEVNGADVVLIAGDVFDTFVPQAEAEEFFYSAVLAMSKFALVLAIAGNHDDADRLTAPVGLARASGILLLGEKTDSRRFSGEYGGKFTSVELGDGFVRIERGGEKATVGYLGYPNGAKLADLAGRAEYGDAVKELVQKSCAEFTAGGINIFVSHLFVAGFENETTDERELGGSKLLNPSVLDIPHCTYAALGHIHKPMTVSKSKNIYYSGSIAQFDFSDKTDKRVIIVDTDGKRTSIQSVPITSGIKLATVEVGSEQEALCALEAHPNEYVKIIYRADTPLSPSAMSAMRKFPCFVDIEVVTRAAEVTDRARRGKTDGELFVMFYEVKEKKPPTKELSEIFLKAVSGEEL